MSSEEPPHTTEQKGDKGTLGDFISNVIKTPGVKNIEAAYSRAGATNHHTPGSASQLGNQSQVGANEGKGVGSQHFTDKISDQRQEPSAIGKIFNNMINGTSNTK